MRMARNDWFWNDWICAVMIISNTDYLTEKILFTATHAIMLSSFYGVLAQPVEQRTLNPLVESSNLSRPTNPCKNFLTLCFITPFRSYLMDIFNNLQDSQELKWLIYTKIKPLIQDLPDYCCRLKLLLAILEL